MTGELNGGCIIWLKAPEAAAYIGMSQQWLDYSRFPNLYGIENGPPFHRMGPRAIRYSKAELDAWLASRRVDPGAASPAT